MTLLYLYPLVMVVVIFWLADQMEEPTDLIILLMCAICWPLFLVAVWMWVSQERRRRR